MRTCQRCQQILPDDAFRADYRTYCRTCHQDINTEWKRRNNAEYAGYRRALEESKKGPEANPGKYTHAVCERIAGVTQRAITRWEEATNQEAPPHLTAILQLAQQVAAEHEHLIPPRPNRIRYYHTCISCLQPFASSQPHARYCSQRCEQRVERARQLADIPEPEPKPKKPKTRPEVIEARHLYRETEGALIRLYRANGFKWQTIADVFEIPGRNPGNAYWRAHYRRPDSQPSSDH